MKAIRRHHHERIKERAKQRLRDIWNIDEPSAAMIGRHTNTGTVCSCPHCGNPRRHFGQKTIQERRADLVLYDDKER